MRRRGRELGVIPSLGAAMLAALATGLLAASCASTTPPADGASTGSHPHFHVIGLPNFALPPASAGCHGATPVAGGATQLPVTVSRVGTQVAVLANVCIDGRGPFPFVIDTGASESVVVTSLASQLALPAAGSLQRFEGVGCSAAAQPRQVASWSLAGLPLAGQDVSGATIPGMGAPGQPDGLLGSDVLNRFGAVRFDFAAATLTVPGPEGPAATSQRTVQGPTATPTPPSLLAGTTGGTVALRVDTGPALNEVIAPVRLGTNGHMPFAVDTGSSQTVLDRSLARAHMLAHTNTLERQTTVCSTITVPTVKSGEWSVGQVPLSSGLVATVNLGPVQTAGFVGLLGSDQLVKFGWVVFDYRGALLVLGSG